MNWHCLIIHIAIEFDLKELNGVVSNSKNNNDAIMKIPNTTKSII